MLATLFERFISGQIKLAFQFARVMAAVAALLEDGNDVFVETDGLVVGGRNGEKRTRERNNGHPKANTGRNWTSEKILGNGWGRNLLHRNQLHLALAGAEAAAGGAFVANSACSGGVTLSAIWPVRAL